MNMRYRCTFGFALLLLVFAGCESRPIFVRDRSFQVALPDCWHDVTVRRCFDVDRVHGVVWIDDWANDQLLVRRYDGSLVQTVSYRNESAFGQAAKGEGFYAHLVFSLVCSPRPDNLVFVLSGTNEPRIVVLDHNGDILGTYTHLNIAPVSGHLHLRTDREGYLYVVEKINEIPGRGSPGALGLTKCYAGFAMWWLQYASWSYDSAVAPDGTVYLVGGANVVEIYHPDGHIIKLSSIEDALGGGSRLIGVDQNQRMFLVGGSEKRYLAVHDSDGKLIAGPQFIAALGAADRTPVKIDDLGGVYFVKQESDGLYLARFVLSNQ